MIKRGLSQEFKVVLTLKNQSIQFIIVRDKGEKPNDPLNRCKKN